MNGEGRSKLWILASGRHTLSHTLLSDTPVTMSLKAILKNHFRLILSLLQCCECYDAIMHLADTDLHSYAVRPCQGKEIGMQFQTGITRKERIREQCRCQKAHRGLPATGFACIGVVVFFFFCILYTWVSILYDAGCSLGIF